MDHSPWGSFDEVYAAIMHDICAALVPPPGIAAPIPSSKSPAVQRFVKRGFYMCCATCGYTIEFCPGHPTIASGPDGSTESSLNKRIVECKGR